MGGVSAHRMLAISAKGGTACLSPRAIGLQRRWSLQTLPDDGLEVIDTMRSFVAYANGYLHLSSVLHASYRTANKK